MKTNVKYALWTLSRERCVIIGQELRTLDGQRLVFSDVGVMIKDGLLTTDCQLTEHGKLFVPTDISSASRANAMKFFVIGERYVFVGGNVVRADGAAGKVSRYVAEVLMSKGVLVWDNRGGIVRPDHGPTESWKIALWTLSREKCQIVNGVLYTVVGQRLVFRDAHALIVNGYMTEDVTITPTGAKLIPDALGYTTVQQTMSVFSDHSDWVFSGNFAKASDGATILRYKIERLIEMGKLQIDTGGCIHKAEQRQRIQMDVTTSELEAIRQCTTSTVTLIRPPATA